MPIYRFYECNSIIVMATSRKEAEAIAEHILKKRVTCRNLKGLEWESAKKLITGETLMVFKG